MPKKRDLQTPQTTVAFRCESCRITFDAEPREVLPDPDQPHHPYRYITHCPDCLDDCEQAPFQRGLFKAWANATGPKTDQGKAASAKNLEGHPTQEEALRTRFNALRHGLSARTAQYFPARPDKYPACSSCDVDRDYCQSQPACTKQTQLFMQHHAAFEQKNPKHLQAVYADIQASITAIIQMILQTIIADGVKISAPAWKVDRDGGIVIGRWTNEKTGEIETIMDVSAHPLLKPLTEFLTRNNLSLADLGMTPKAIENEEQQLGKLAPTSADAKTISLEDFAAKQAASLEKLRELADRANARKNADPVLIEYRQQNGDGA